MCASTGIMTFGLKKKILSNFLILIYFRLRTYGGRLDYNRFELTCYLCRVKQGSCIQCDYKSCQKAFHVRCAIDEKLIVSAQEMDELKLGDWNIKVFCGKHTNIGKKKVQKLQLQKFLASNGNHEAASKVIIDDEDSDNERFTRRTALL